MNIKFTTIDDKNRLRNFSWWFPNIETAFDVLSTLCTKGQWLIKAELIDELERTALPIAAFDGVAISPVLNELEKEWQLLLDLKPHQS
ncbi:hypothetical protein [Spirosoma aerophilum]